MLLLGTEIDLDGVTVCRDHAVPTTFYYLPGSPRVVTRDGQSGLQLIRYRGGSAGGMLTLEVDLTVAPETLEAAREALAERVGGEVHLAPVLFTHGAVRLTALGAVQPAALGPGDAAAAAAAPGLLVEDILGTALPSLLGGGRAIFSVALDREGASLVAATMRDGDAPLVVVYDLSFTGLRPARGLRARVEYGMAYDYLRTRVAANTLLFKADLDREAEALSREGHIEIEDVDYQGGDPALLAKRQEEIRATLREMSESIFFRPAASPRSLGAQTIARHTTLASAWSAQGNATAAFVLRAREQHEEQTLTYDLREARAVTTRIAPQGALRHPEGVDPSRAILDVDIAEPLPFTEVRVYTLPDADWTAAQSVVVDVRRGEEVATAMVSPTVAEGNVTVRNNEHPLEYRLSPQIIEDPLALGTPPARDLAFRPLDANNLLIDPAAIGGHRVVTIVLGVVDADAIRQVRGALSLGDRACEFVLDAQHPEARIPVWGADPLTVAAEFLTPDGSSISQQLPVAEGETLVVINQPSGRYYVVSIAAQDPLNRYESILVEIEHVSGSHRRAFRLEGGTASVRWSAALPAGAERAFRYRTKKVGRNAQIVEEEWQPGAGALLLVGDVDMRVENIEIVPLGAAATFGAVVRVTSVTPPPGAEATVETLLEPDTRSVRIRLPFRTNAPRTYRVEGEVFTETDTRPIGPFEARAEVLLLRLGT